MFQINQKSSCSCGRIMWRSSNERWRINWPSQESSCFDRFSNSSVCRSPNNMWRLICDMWRLVNCLCFSFGLNFWLLIFLFACWKCFCWTDVDLWSFFCTSWFLYSFVFSNFVFVSIGSWSDDDLCFDWLINDEWMNRGECWDVFGCDFVDFVFRFGV